MYSKLRSESSYEKYFYLPKWFFWSIKREIHLTRTGVVWKRDILCTLAGTAKPAVLHYTKLDDNGRTSLLP